MRSNFWHFLYLATFVWKVSRASLTVPFLVMRLNFFEPHCYSRLCGFAAGRCCCGVSGFTNTKARTLKARVMAAALAVYTKECSIAYFLDISPTLKGKAGPSQPSASPKRVVGFEEHDRHGARGEIPCGSRRRAHRDCLSSARGTFEQCQAALLRSTFAD